MDLRIGILLTLSRRPSPLPHRAAPLRTSTRRPLGYLASFPALPLSAGAVVDEPAGEEAVVVPLSLLEIVRLDSILSTTSASTSSSPWPPLGHRPLLSMVSASTSSSPRSPPRHRPLHDVHLDIVLCYLASFSIFTKGEQIEHASN
jgi:hypothetical protein